jgi:N-acetyl sugar amidotransferase
MDTSDPKITFNPDGKCDYCINFYENIKPNWNPIEGGNEEINLLIEKVKKDGLGKQYDCLIGISGGLDSSYVTHIAVNKFGLRPLMFHCDTGWNSDLGVSNIQKIIEGLNLDLVTEVVNWEEMKDLQRAFFKSQVSFVDTPQDLALFSALYNFAKKNSFKYIITGGNISTECVRESLDWTYFSTDTKHVKHIHSIHGEKKLDTFPMCDILKYKTFYRWINKIQVIKLLDSVPFIKKNAIKELNSLYGWQEYPQKHYESRFTRFYESFWTPKKFNFDKRRAYFSSEILTGQMTRDQALEMISKPQLDEETMIKEFEFVAKKLDFTIDEFNDIFHGKNKSFRDYKNNFNLITLGTKLSKVLGLENRKFR